MSLGIFTFSPAPPAGVKVEWSPVFLLFLHSPRIRKLSSRFLNLSLFVLFALLCRTGAVGHTSFAPFCKEFFRRICGFHASYATRSSWVALRFVSRTSSGSALGFSSSRASLPSLSSLTVTVVLGLISFFLKDVSDGSNWSVASVNFTFVFLIGTYEMPSRSCSMV